MPDTPHDWRDALLAIAREADDAFGGLTAAAFNAAPTPGAWSAGQCLAHLTATAAPLLPRLDTAVAGLARNGRTGHGPYRTGAVGAWFARLLAPPAAAADGRTPPPPRRMSAPSMYAPPPGPLDVDGTLAAFRAVYTGLARVAGRSDGWAIDRVRVGSPAFPLLRLSAAAWLEVSVQHGRRHLAQAHRAAASRAPATA